MARTPKKDDSLIQEYQANPSLNKEATKPTGKNISTAKDADKKI